MNSTWLILGASPDADDVYARVRPTLKDVTVATCNSGIDIEPEPHVYWISDRKAAKMHLNAIRLARSLGTHIITSGMTAMYDNDIRDVAHEVVCYSLHPSTVWTPGKYVNSRTSGAMLVQYAVNSGATEIHLVGFCGYMTTKQRRCVEYFHGVVGGEWCESVMKTYGPLLQNIIDQSPQVKWIMHGEVGYPWCGTERRP